MPITEILARMLAAAKRFPDLVRAQDRAEWLPRPPGMGELQGTRALVLGYGPTFGLIAVDRETQERIVKPSAKWLGEIARKNRLD